MTGQLVDDLLMPSEPSDCDVLIIGGGLAGLAAAGELARRDLKVRLLESRGRLGGRASSFVDHESGDMIDNCQHVAMGCCTAFLEFCRQFNMLDQFQRERELTFLAPSCPPYRFAAGWFPAPLHLSGAFLGLPYLALSEKWQFAMGVRTLWRSSPAALRGRSFGDWLREHGQSDRIIRRIWEVLLVSALSESMDRIDAAYARQVLVQGFLESRDGWEVYVPQRPLDELLTQFVLPGLQQLGVDVQFSTGVAELQGSGDALTAAKLNSGSAITASSYVLAVPWHRVQSMLSEQVFEALRLPNLNQIASAPITSVHLWVDRPLMSQRHVVLVDRLCQWLFEHPCHKPGQGMHRYQVVISASRMLSGWGREETIRQVWSELQQAFPQAAHALLSHARVVTEHRAVFSPLPGIDALRPSQQTSIPNLQLAGDWTQTGWPATMESAVRSGLQAARNILKERG